jgi:hypothetical protein
MTRMTNTTKTVRSFKDEPKPCLTMRTHPDADDVQVVIISGPYPYEEHPEDKTIDSGFDSNGPCGHTWWRIVERGRQKFYLSTVRNTGAKVLVTEDGHHVCRPGQFLQIETDVT